MQEAVIQHLIEVNRRFYRQFGESFSATRQRLQPGVKRLLRQIPPESSLLDLGCGNGELALELHSFGHTGIYLGLDFSPVLLAEASRKTSRLENIHFRLVDLTQPDWYTAAGLPTGEAATLDAVLVFAVLHHLPGRNLRVQLLRQARRLLKPGGWLMHSEWQFLNSPRLRSRIQDWQAAGLEQQQVETGDYLLDWRSGGSGLRYVHHFERQELDELASAAGFTVEETFKSDGEGGRLSIYQVWKVA